MPTAKKATKPKTAAKPRPKTVRKSSTAKSSSLKKTSRFSTRQLLVFVLIFGAIGGYLIYRSLAAPPVVASIQGESMAGGASNLAVIGASGNSVKRFSRNTTISGRVTLPSAATSLSVIARGTTCKPWWPWVAVSVDGTTRIAAQKVGQTGFKSYTANANIAAGTHTVVVTASNDGVTATGCQRHLDVDVVTFFGASGTTSPTPPITPPVQPTGPEPNPPVTPPVIQPTPPVSGGQTVGVPYTCTGPVNGIHVVGTGSDSIALVNLKSGCTGSLSFDVTITSGGGDGVKVQGGAHDLNIGPSTIVCSPGVAASMHQDGVQVQGGSNVIFHGLKVVCPYVTGNGAGAFYVNGADFGGINNVICDGCNLEHTHGGVTYNQGKAPITVNSGARNSILHNPHPSLDYTSAGGSPGFLNQNNTVAPACTTLANC